LLTDPLFYAVAIPAVVFMGLAKGGFTGVGQLAVPLLALVVSPVQAAAILLPILLLQDAVGVWAFRQDWDGRVLSIMLPGAAVGILAGWLLATAVSVSAVLGALGIISILFALHRILVTRRGALTAPADSPAPVGFAFGVGSGFTSQLAHAGVPLFQMWVLPKRLPPRTLVGTTAIYFGVVNWLKVPAYAALGQLTRGNLLTALALFPVAIASTLAGVWLVNRVSADRFYTLIYLLLIAVGSQLVWKAFSGG
jgi:uncharacterized membrane protein YfcA